MRPDSSVAVPPKITPFSFRADVHLGERVGVQCVVSKGDAPLHVHWLKDDQEIGRGEGIVVRNLDQFTSVLSISALARQHGGNYTCVARNAAARASHSAPLSVNGTAGPRAWGPHVCPAAPRPPPPSDSSSFTFISVSPSSYLISLGLRPNIWQRITSEMVCIYHIWDTVMQFRE